MLSFLEKHTFATSDKLCRSIFLKLISSRNKSADCFVFFLVICTKYLINICEVDQYHFKPHQDKIQIADDQVYTCFPLRSVTRSIISKCLLRSLTTKQVHVTLSCFVMTKNSAASSSGMLQNLPRYQCHPAQASNSSISRFNKNPGAQSHDCLIYLGNITSFRPFSSLFLSFLVSENMNLMPEAFDGQTEGTHIIYIAWVLLTVHHHYNVHLLSVFAYAKLLFQWWGIHID